MLNSDTLAEVNIENSVCPTATFFAEIFFRWYRWDESYINGAENSDDDKNFDSNDDENDHDSNGYYGDIDNNKIKTDFNGNATTSIKMKW